MQISKCCISNPKSALTSIETDIFDGKKTFDQVPRLLKDKVKEVLIDSGMEELIAEE